MTQRQKIEWPKKATDESHDRYMNN